MPPPAHDRWAILARIPKVVKDMVAERRFPPGADISVACNELPRASVLTVPLRVSSPPSLSSYPYVAAADRTGLLLLCATEPYTNTSSVLTYHLCDAQTGEAISLPEHHRPVGFHGDNVGLIARQGNCLVAELQPAGDGTGRATLLCYTVGKGGKWVEKELTYSPPLRRYWFGQGVISHDGRLWWVDLSYGLLTCDPFADEPELLHVPLPKVLDQLPVISANSGAHRCVRVSGGRLRYVQLHGSSDAPVVSTWALDSYGEWNRERSIQLADVWADESYLDTMLTWSIPALALLHPLDPDKVYFFLESSIFAVDLRLNKVVEFSEFAMPDQPNQLIMRSSRFVHAWQYEPKSRTFEGSEFILTSLRLEKGISAQSSLTDIRRFTSKTAKKMKRYRGDLIREQQQAVRMTKPRAVASIQKKGQNL